MQASCIISLTHLLVISATWHRDAHLNLRITMPSVICMRMRDVSCIADYVWYTYVGSVALAETTQTYSVITITTIPENDIICFTVQIHREHYFLVLNSGLEYEIQVPNIEAKCIVAPTKLLGFTPLLPYRPPWWWLTIAEHQCTLDKFWSNHNRYIIFVLKLVEPEAEVKLYL